jgi:hypoxanthine phosphoribosyltransferase
MRQRGGHMQNDDVEKILLSTEIINEKVKELGAEISRDYAGKDLILINVLKGGFIFIADLVRHISIPVTIDFMAISSYGSSTKTSGVVQVIKDLQENIVGKHVLIIEDIIDTGLTLNYLIKNLKSREPESINVCVLLDKSPRRIIDNLPIKYKGFDIPDYFVIGYGLDYRQQYRNLPFVGILKKSIYDFSI